MTHIEDLLRLREQEAVALRKKVEELEAKIEILTQQIMTNDIYE
jgi:predicted nuclease with TOPRIM domain